MAIARKAKKKVTKKKVAKKRVTKKRVVRRRALLDDPKDFARLIRKMSRTPRSVRYDESSNEGSAQITGLGELVFWQGNDGINFEILGPIRIKSESTRQAVRVLEQLQMVVFDS